VCSDASWQAPSGGGGSGARALSRSPLGSPGGSVAMMEVEFGGAGMVGRSPSASPRRPALLLGGGGGGLAAGGGGLAPAARTPGSGGSNASCLTAVHMASPGCHGRGRASDAGAGGGGRGHDAAWYGQRLLRLSKDEASDRLGMALQLRAGMQEAGVAPTLATVHAFLQ
jgi:hypothetical protein